MAQNPHSLYRVPSSATFGMDMPDDPLIQDMQRHDFSSSDPHKMARNMEFLANMIEQIHVTTRDNNAIMFQLLASFEERMNGKVQELRNEMTAAMDQKLENMAALHTQQIRELEAKIASAPHHSSSSSLSGRRDGGAAPAARRASTLPTFPAANDNKSTLSTIEEEIQYDMKTAVPNAGFVIKTRKLLGNKEKTFINVFHHETVDLEPPSSARNFTADNKPFIVIGDVSHSLDKEGTNRVTYNVCVSSEYFKIRDSAETELKITSPQAISKIIHKVNLKYTEYLDENGFSLPKVANGYIGDEILPMQIPVPVKKPQYQATGRHNNINNNNNTITSTSSNTNGVANHTPSLALRTTGSTATMQSRTSFSSDIDGHGVSDDGGDANSVVSELTLDNTSVLGGTYNNGNRRGLSSSSQLQPRRSTDSITSQGIAAPSSVKDGGRPPRKIQRKSVFDVSTGRRLVNASMLEYVKEECVDVEAADAVIERSSEDPAILLGWQIELREGEQKGIYVVTDVKKNMMSKSEFRLTSAAIEDVWVKLKRAEGKSGLEFRPLRKVLFALGGDDSNDYDNGSVRNM